MIGAVVIHVGLVALLMTRLVSSGLVVADQGEGEGMSVALTHAPSAASLAGRTSAQTSDPAPPHPPALASTALDPDPSNADKPDAVAPSKADHSSPSAASGLPTDALAMRSKLGLLAPPARPAASNPWAQASYKPQASQRLVLDLWPEVAPCWQGRNPSQPIRLRLSLDPFGGLLSSDLLQIDGDDGAPSTQALAAAKAAVVACSPYLERGDATAFEVIFPVTLPAPAPTSKAG